MKKNLILSACVLFFACLIGVSCKKDKSEVTILGKWYAESESLQYYENGQVEFDSTISYSGEFYYEFLGDGKVNIQNEGGTTGSYTYTYDSNTKHLTIVEEGDAYEFDVQTLTENRLIISYDEAGSDEDSGLEYRLVDKITFKR